MEIKQISVYKVDLPLYEGCYKWSEGKSVDVFDCTIVRIITNRGIEGWGEVTPLGPFYLPAYAEGARTGIRELAHHLIGKDPTQVAVINQIMDKAMLGHNYVKSAIDMACWDLLGKVTEQPICNLFGGRFGETIDLYRAISQDTPEAMAKRVAEYRAEGYRKFQLKCGSSVDEDIARIKAAAAELLPGDILVADANTGWKMHEAARVVDAVRDVDVYIEQPCKSYEECLSIRRRTARPFILDENINSVDSLLQAHKDGGIDCVNIKISKVGGLSKAKQIRDLCVSLGYPMTIEDSWGGDIITAAISHLAHSTPEEFRFSATDFNSYVTVATAAGAPHRQNGKLRASKAPGLGVRPNMDVLGDPVFTVGE
mmetsp:Transcript_12718/g.23627  ORF Transcript_12718/g.23627 Transcript_12718/m.23627 type:complete len:369 (-) Transcript_12718:130-1236(-)